MPLFAHFFAFLSCIRLCMAIWLIMDVYSLALYAGFPSFISPEFYSGFIICRCFLRSLPPDRIRHSSFILSDAIRATFTLSYIGVASSSAYLCLFRHKTLPISAYLGIKWHIFVKSDFFSNIGLLVTYPILYLCTVKGQSGSPTDANGVHPVGRAAHIRVTSLKTQF